MKTFKEIMGEEVPTNISGPTSLANTDSNGKPDPGVDKKKRKNDSVQKRKSLEEEKYTAYPQNLRQMNATEKLKFLRTLIKLGTKELRKRQDLVDKQIQRTPKDRANLKGIENLQTYRRYLDMAIDEIEFKNEETIHESHVDTEGTFAGKRVFDVSPETFAKCRLCKGKYDLYKKYLDPENEEDNIIKQFALKNRHVIVRDKSTGAMTFLKVPYSDSPNLFPK